MAAATMIATEAGARDIDLFQDAYALCEAWFTQSDAASAPSRLGPFQSDNCTTDQLGPAWSTRVACSIYFRSSMDSPFFDNYDWSVERSEYPSLTSRSCQVTYQEFTDLDRPDVAMGRAFLERQGLVVRHDARDPSRDGLAIFDRRREGRITTGSYGVTTSDPAQGSPGPPRRRIEIVFSDIQLRQDGN